MMSETNWYYIALKRYWANKDLLVFTASYHIPIQYSLSDFSLNSQQFMRQQVGN